MGQNKNAPHGSILVVPLPHKPCMCPPRGFHLCGQSTNTPANVYWYALPYKTSKLNWTPNECISSINWDRVKDSRGGLVGF